MDGRERREGQEVAEQTNRRTLVGYKVQAIDRRVIKKINFASSAFLTN